MILALTANGPGEFAGWVRPLLSALYERDAALDVRVFCVPDDYASGHEAGYIRRYFPQATAYTPAEYLRFALGRPLEGLPSRARSSPRARCGDANFGSAAAEAR